MEPIKTIDQTVSPLTPGEMIARMVDYSAGLTDQLPDPAAVPTRLIGADQDVLEAMQTETTLRIMDRQQYGPIENYDQQQAVEYLSKDIILKAGLRTAILEAGETARDEKLIGLRDWAIELENVEFASEVANILSIIRNSNIEPPSVDCSVSEEPSPEPLDGEIAGLEQVYCQPEVADSEAESDHRPETDFQRTDQVLDLVNVGRAATNNSLAKSALIEARELAISMQQLELAAFVADILTRLRTDEKDL